MKAVKPLVFEDLFPEEKLGDLQDELIMRLRSLCCAATLKYCIHTNLFVSDLENPRFSITQQVEILRMFMGRAKLEQLIKRAQPSKLGRQIVEAAFFHRMQLLEMIRLIIVHSPEVNCHKNPVRNEKTKRKYLQAALLTNEIVTYRQANMDELHNELDQDRKREKLLRTMRWSAQRSPQVVDVARAFGRGQVMFFDFLPQEFPSFAKEFENLTKMTLAEYYSCLVITLVHYYNIPLVQNSHNRHLVSVQQVIRQVPTMAKAFENYLSLEASTIDELRVAFMELSSNDLDLAPIRNRPVLRLNEDLAIVIDPIFHIEKA